MPRIDELEDYEVRSADGKRIGSVDHLWVDEATRRLELVGVVANGKPLAIPALNADINEEEKAILVRYDEAMIKEAPEVRAEDQLDVAMEERIFAHYGLIRSTEESPTGLPAPARGPAAGMRAAETEREPGMGAIGGAGMMGAAEAGRETERAPLPEGREGIHIPLAEEELHIGKRRVEEGGVLLRKVVRTRPVDEEVELAREEIEIERVPARGDRVPERAFEEQEFFIPLMKEEAVVEKTAHVHGAVDARKHTETDRESVHAELRREELEVDRERGPTPPRANRSERE